jgi:hypothetical protein
MKRVALVITIIALYVLHQDLWFWRTAKPLVFGFLPVGLFYHACYTLIVALVLAILVRYGWPDELEAGLDDPEAAADGDRTRNTGREGEKTA